MHWHYDYIFGVYAINGVSIAHEKTNEFLIVTIKISK